MCVLSFCVSFRVVEYLARLHSKGMCVVPQTDIPRFQGARKASFQREKRGPRRINTTSGQPIALPGLGAQLPAGVVGCMVVERTPSTSDVILVLFICLVRQMCRGPLPDECARGLPAGTRRSMVELDTRLRPLPVRARNFFQRGRTDGVVSTRAFFEPWCLMVLALWMPRSWEVSSCCCTAADRKTVAA